MKLEDIENLIWGVYHDDVNPSVCVKKVKEYIQTEKEKVKKEMLEIIGEDEPEYFVVEGYTSGVMSNATWDRNNLRQELREKVKNH